MGSNQMSSKATTGVVDPRGRVWGTESLYVADASVFPTASAVNPMITVSLPSLPVARLSPRFELTLPSSQNMSLSHSIAQFIDQDIREKLKQPLEARL